jgi:HSP20 family molecular chaperone IbpA
MTEFASPFAGHNPVKQLLDSFSTTMHLHMQPYGVRSADVEPEQTKMNPIVLDRIMSSINGCKCNVDCPCSQGKPCTCTAMCCLAKAGVCASAEKRCWCMPSAVVPTSLPTDVVRNEDHYLFLVDVPGCRKEDLKVECLPIGPSEGKKATKAPSCALSITVARMFDKGQTFLRKERPFGQLQRRFLLPNDACMEGVSCKWCESGMLTVHVPRSKLLPAKSKSIDIE